MYRNFYFHYLVVSIQDMHMAVMTNCK